MPVGADQMGQTHFLVLGQLGKLQATAAAETWFSTPAALRQHSAAASPAWQTAADQGISVPLSLSLPPGFKPTRMFCYAGHGG